MQLFHRTTAKSLTTLTIMFNFVENTEILKKFEKLKSLENRNFGA